MSVEHEHVIEAPERAVWAVDGGESGYVIVWPADVYVDRDGTAWNFIVLTDCAVTLGTSDPGNTEVRDVKAGGPITVPSFKDAGDVLVSLAGFLSHAAEEYRLYDMKAGNEGKDLLGDDLIFNAEIRGWAYLNSDSIDVFHDELS